MFDLRWGEMGLIAMIALLVIGPKKLPQVLRTVRTWLGAVGTQMEVQQKLMRHADIRTTMNIYGDVVTDEMEQAHKKVVGLALNGLQSGLQ